MVNAIWLEFLHIIKQEVGSRVVETWFKAITFLHWDAQQKTVYLQAPNGFVAEWVKKNYLSLLQIHLGRLLHVELPKIFISEKEIEISEKKEESLQPVFTPARSIAKSVSTINQQYSFDSFVVGPHNSLAFAAAQAVTEKPGMLYNPLFIYGPSGLGKTHLLHAIGNEFKAKNKAISLLYQTADRFVTEFIYSIRYDKVHQFRQKFQSVDVLLIDDLQFIANKEQSQEAFFHIFNALYNSHKQLVFSSDTFPQQLAGFAERLRSRIAGGLITDIFVPDIATKVAILKRKASMQEQELSDELAQLIAAQANGNIRELEGMLTRVLAYAALTNQQLSCDLVKKVIGKNESQIAAPLDVQQIINRVCVYFSFNFSEIVSKNRNKDLVFARQIIMYLLKKYSDKSYREIGSILGGRDHTTVIHAIEKIEVSIAQDDEIARLIIQLTAVPTKT